MDFDKDRVTLVKSDGALSKEDVPALVVGNKIYTHDQSLPLQVGDHLLRKLPNGLVEDYEITNPAFFNLGTDSHFQIEVRKVGVPSKQSTIIHHITNHFTGSNARVNINSSDQSINVSSDFSQDQLRKFVDQVRPVISYLPEGSREFVATQLEAIEEEARRTKPEKMTVLGALQSIKSIVEGASGNLVAAGIISMIGAML